MLCRERVPATLRALGQGPFSVPKGILKKKGRSHKHEHVRDANMRQIIREAEQDLVSHTNWWGLWGGENVYFSDVTWLKILSKTKLGGKGGKRNKPYIDMDLTKEAWRECQKTNFISHSDRLSINYSCTMSLSWRQEEEVSVSLCVSLWYILSLVSGQTCKLASISCVPQIVMTPFILYSSLVMNMLKNTGTRSYHCAL